MRWQAPQVLGFSSASGWDADGMEYGGGRILQPVPEVSSKLGDFYRRSVIRAIAGRAVLERG